MLDAIALLIGSQSQGSYVAAALDRQHPLSFVLAKTLPRAADLTNSVRFFEAVCAATTYIEIQDFVLSTSHETIRNKWEKIATTPVECIRECLRKYEPGLVENEFDLNHPYIEVLYDTHFDTKEILRVIIDGLQAILPRDTTPDHPSSASDDDVQTDLDDVINLAAVFVNTAFLAFALKDSECSAAAAKYKRRLEKLSQYQSSIFLILRMRRRFVSLGALTIPHRWVNPLFINHSVDTLNLAKSPLVVAQRSLPVMAETLMALNSRIFDVWTDTVNPVFHPELLLLFYFHIHDLEPDPTEPTRDTNKRAIGSNKRTCHCCCAWIEHFNGVHQVQWETSQTGGKSFRDWALSGVPTLDKPVVDMIANLIRRELQRANLEKRLPVRELAFGNHVC